MTIQEIINELNIIAEEASLLQQRATRLRGILGEVSTSPTPSSKEQIKLQMREAIYNTAFKKKGLSDEQIQKVNKKLHDNFFKPRRR